MDNIRKLSLTLSILCVALVLTVCTLGLVLVSGTQGVITDLDIHYAGKSNAVKVVVGDTCANSKTIVTKEFKVGDTVQYSDLSIPQTPNKVFIGWYTDENLNTQATFPYTLQDITTLYAGYLDASDCLEYTYASRGQYDGLPVYCVTISSTYDSSFYPELVVPGYYDDGANGVLRVEFHQEDVNNISGKLILGSLVLGCNPLIDSNRSLSELYLYNTEGCGFGFYDWIGEYDKTNRVLKGALVYMYGNVDDITFDNCVINDLRLSKEYSYNNICFRSTEFLCSSIIIPASCKWVYFNCCYGDNLTSVIFEDPAGWEIDVSDQAANAATLVGAGSFELVKS